jgi:hypothetical protein
MFDKYIENLRKNNIEQYINNKMIYLKAKNYHI